VLAAFDIGGATPTFTAGTSNILRTNDTTPASASGSPPVGALLMGSSSTVDGSAGLGMVTAGLELLGNPTTGTGADDSSALLAWKVAVGDELEVNNAGASADSYVHYWWFDVPTVQPSDWTERWHTDGTATIEDDAGATGGKRLEWFGSGTSRRFLSWDAIDSDADRDDVEVLCRFMLSNAGVLNVGMAAARGSGGDTSETGYTVRLNGNTPWRTTVHEYDNAASFILDNDSKTFVADVWYWCRARFNGTAIKVSRWAGAVGDEPGAWDIETTDVTSTIGWVGAFLFDGNVCYWDVFGVGTNGDSAPSEPVVRGWGRIPIGNLPQ